MQLTKYITYVLLFINASHAVQIEWGACNDNLGSPIPVDCGRFLVPLDYTDTTPDAEMLSLELLRVPAKVQPADGSIVLNFGGPGAPGRNSLADAGPLLQELSGGNYNLISFDPRGTGSTIPFKCYIDDAEISAYVRDMLSVPRVRDKSQLGRLWARASITVEKCAQRQNRTGTLLSTAFVARDILGIAEAVGEDDLLRYWGFSYGTTLGATLVSMFPEKVDKVIIDGVQNPHEYYNDYADIEEWSDTDAEFSQIFEHCVKNSGACPFSRSGVPAAELEQSVWDLLEKLDTHPVAIGDYIVDRPALIYLISEALYSTTSWPNITTTFDMLINGPQDIPFLREMFRDPAGNVEDLPEEFLTIAQSILGIHCGDRAARAGSLEALTPTLEKMANISRIFDGVPGYINLPCAQWQFEPKERYTGDFQVTPRNPVLIIGNTWDGLTPLRSAKNVSSGFEGSVVLEVQGHGHTSVRTPSACGLRVIRDYWQHGNLPKVGTVCEVDAPPFSNVTWDDVLRDEMLRTDKGNDQTQIRLDLR